MDPLALLSAEGRNVLLLALIKHEGDLEVMMNLQVDGSEEEMRLTKALLLRLNEMKEG